jgi:hypothetical protein
VKVRLTIAGACLVAGTSLAFGDIRLEYVPNELGIQGPKQIYQEDQTYSCAMQDAVSIRADGTLGHKVGPLNIWSNELPLRFNINSGTGIFSVGDREEQWEILRLGSDIRTLIAHNPNRSPLNTQLRIVTYTVPMLFWLTDSTDVISGTCEPL